MMSSIGIYKVPGRNQYVCPEGYHFMWNGVNMGRIIYTSNPEGYWIDKDDNLDITVELEEDETDIEENSK